MIPPFDQASGNLPPGIHLATWEEILARYGYTPHRLMLLVGLKTALDTLRQAGCPLAYLDGSFVTAKEMPNDFDVCWTMVGVDFDLLLQLDPTLLDWKDARAAQKGKFRGELFIAEAPADHSGATYLEFFQRDRDTEDPKGIVAIDLGDLP